MTLHHGHSEGVWKSIAAGAIGGLVASVAMNQFQAAITAVSAAVAKKERERKSQVEAEDGPEDVGDDATVKAAKAISTGIFGHELTKGEKQWAAPAVHYTLGTTLGAIYGALASSTEIAIGNGIAYGAAVWLAADEIAVPFAGFAGPPSETPLSGHVYALASHLLFGMVTHATRKLVLS